MEKPMKFGSWRGLFQKEWIISRGEVTTLLFLNAAIGSVLPIIISETFNIPQDISDSLLIFVGIWLLAHMFIGFKLLFTSLRYEMKRPDIWLHSPRSIFQLIGVKVAYAAMITAELLIVGSMTFGLSMILYHASLITSLTDGVLVLLSGLIATFLISICVMAIGFFFWSIYQVFRVRLGNISVVIILGLFFGSLYLLEKFKVPSIFNTIIAFGPVKLTDANFLNATSYHPISMIVPDGVIFSLGGLLVYGGITAILFLLGSVFFEKKVRY